MSEPLSSRKRPLKHASEEEEKKIPKKKVVAADCIILLADAQGAHMYTFHFVPAQDSEQEEATWI